MMGGLIGFLSNSCRFRNGIGLALGLLLVGALFAANPAWTQETAAPAVEEAVEVVADATASSPGSTTAFICWLVAFLGAFVALVQAKWFYDATIRADGGTDRMKEIAGYVTEGANAYLQQQYRVVAAFFFVVALLLAYAAFGMKVQSGFVPFAFLSGACLVALPVGSE